jgi:cobalt-zinc-cadmium efflux system membrane fusion protein
MMRQVGTPAVCLVALTLVSGACNRGSKTETNATAIPVTTATAELGSITAVLQAAGTVMAAPGAEQIVTAPEPARIAELPKSEHDIVVEGELLARFEIASVNSEAAKQVSDVARVELKLQSAKVALARAQELFAQGVAPRMNVDDAQTQVAAAEAELRGARATADAEALGNSARTVVRALFNGVVDRKFREVGDLVQPGTSAILSVIDPTRLEVTTSLPYSEASRLSLGNGARITTPPDGSVVSNLHVVFRPESANDRSTPVPVRLAFDAPPTIGVGTSVPLAINAETHDGTLLVPLTAVMRDGDAAWLFVVSGGTAQRRAVTVGITDAEHAEIVSGLDRGEVVVVDAQDALFDGAKVSAQAAAPASPGK